MWLPRRSEVRTASLLKYLSLFQRRLSKGGIFGLIPLPEGPRPQQSRNQAEIATPRGRPLPGQEFHPLEQRAFLHGALGPVQDCRFTGRRPGRGSANS